MDEQATLGAVEEVAEVIVPEVVHTVNVVKTNPVLLVGVALVSVAIGGVVGYKLAEKKLTTKYDKILDEQIESAKKFYGRLHKEGEFATPESAAEKLITDAVDALESYKGGRNLNRADIPPAEEVAVVVEEIVEKNIFVESKPIDADVDYEDLVDRRNPEKPYLITAAEFMENEPGYLQNTLTYYEGDDVLVDERDMPIEEVEGTVGVDNLSKFGLVSGEKHIVYIRNERLDLDFEVVRSEGKYSEQVLGFIEHSDKPRSRRRSRWGDDE